MDPQMARSRHFLFDPPTRQEHPMAPAFRMVVRMWWVVVVVETIAAADTRFRTEGHIRLVITRYRMAARTRSVITRYRTVAHTQCLMVAHTQCPTTSTQHHRMILLRIPPSIPNPIRPRIRALPSPRPVVANTVNRVTQCLHLVATISNKAIPCLHLVVTIRDDRQITGRQNTSSNERIFGKRIIRSKDGKHTINSNHSLDGDMLRPRSSNSRVDPIHNRVTKVEDNEGFLLLVVLMTSREVVEVILLREEVRQIDDEDVPTHHLLGHGNEVGTHQPARTDHEEPVSIRLRVRTLLHVDREKRCNNGCLLPLRESQGLQGRKNRLLHPVRGLRHLRDPKWA
mmetsp:Transcript_22464/g.51772  ORF Transcript_22464/g.51772 Transcript_22464/m.51772 type:complete len:341 (+) Transcript_22464:636-1658(+)